MRQSIGACEKYHAAVISHADSENTRIFKECADLGIELTVLGDTIIDSKYNSKVEIIFDWDNWWAVEFSSGPSIELKYLPQIQKYYTGFHNKNIPVDFVKPTDDFSKYDIIVAPVLYMLKDTVADNIKNFVSNGGTFLTTFFSGYVDENDRVKIGGYPSELRDLLGLWVEELDALPPEINNSIQLNSTLEGFSSEYNCNMLFDIINLEGATVLATYGSNFYKGYPVLTCNKFDNGEAYYIASNPETKFIDDLVNYLDVKHSLSLGLENQPGIEITKRCKNNKNFFFILNHNTEEKTLNLKDKTFVNLLTKEKIAYKLILDSRAVVILEEID
jgi:beta-galactosidase